MSASTVLRSSPSQLNFTINFLIDYQSKSQNVNLWIWTRRFLHVLAAFSLHHFHRRCFSPFAEWFSLAERLAVWGCGRWPRLPVGLGRWWRQGGGLGAVWHFLRRWRLIWRCLGCRICQLRGFWSRESLLSYPCRLLRSASFSWLFGGASFGRPPIDSESQRDPSLVWTSWWRPHGNW